MSSKKTNAIGPGTVNMTVNVPKSLAKKLNELASKSGMSRNAYVKTFLEQEAVKEGVTYTKIFQKN